MGDVLKLNRSANDGIEPLKKAEILQKDLSSPAWCLGCNSRIKEKQPRGVSL